MIQYLFNIYDDFIDRKTTTNKKIHFYSLQTQMS